MFDRFTDNAKRVMSGAREAVQSLNHEYIGTEHLLLGLIGVEEGTAFEVLLGLGIELERVRKEILEHFGVPPQDKVENSSLELSGEDLEVIFLRLKNIEGCLKRIKAKIEGKS